MQKSTPKHKTTNINIPVRPALSTQELKKTLPYNGEVVSEKGFSFSFASFDREHKLFNLGSRKGSEPVRSTWFLDLLDCFRNVNKLTMTELQKSIYDLHRIDWRKANASIPKNSEQLEFWQFRINKSKGRVIGFILKHIFYVVWLDPHHNLTDSEGYGTANYYPRPKSDYERIVDENLELKMEVERLYEILDCRTAPSTV